MGPYNDGLEPWQRVGTKISMSGRGGHNLEGVVVFYNEFSDIIRIKLSAIGTEVDVHHASQWAIVSRVPSRREAVEALPVGTVWRGTIARPEQIRIRTPRGYDVIETGLHLQRPLSHLKEYSAVHIVEVLWSPAAP